MGAVPAVIAAYQRTGHGHPSDDESLEVEDDGSFLLRRTNGSPVAGAFAGTVPAARLAALRAAAEAATGAPTGDPAPPPAGRTIEYVATEEDGIAIVSGSTPASAWAELTTLLRHLVLDLVDQPTAAVGAELVDGGRRLVVHQLGPEPVEADPDRATLSLEAIDDEGHRIGVWETPLADLLGAVSEPAGDGTDSWERPPGWSLEIELPHDLPPGRVRGTLVMWIKAGDESATAGLHLETAA